MKGLLRSYVITLFVMYVVDYAIDGISITGGLYTYAIASLVLFLLHMFIKPILKIILLPISVVTLGLTGIFINTIIFYSLDYFMNEITVSSWKFNGIALAGISLPQHEFGIIATYVLSAVVVSLLINFLRWL